MEALAAFGIACNVIQVMDFAAKTASKCREIAETGSTNELLDYDRTSEQLAGLLEGLKISIDDAPKPLGKEDQELYDFSKECCAVAQELQSKLEDLTGATQARKRRKVSQLAKTLVSSGSIRKICRRLEGYERTLNTSLLVRLR